MSWPISLTVPRPASTFGHSASPASMTAAGSSPYTSSDPVTKAAVRLVAPEHVPDESGRRQRSAGGGTPGHNPVSVIGDGRDAGAGAWSRPRVQLCPARPGKGVGDLQKDDAGNRECGRCTQEILGQVRWRSLQLFEGEGGKRVLGCLRRISPSDARRSVG